MAIKYIGSGVNSAKQHLSLLEIIRKTVFKKYNSLHALECK